jgi:hypothetical protein
MRLELSVLKKQMINCFQSCFNVAFKFKLRRYTWVMALAMRHPGVVVAHSGRTPQYAAMLTDARFCLVPRGLSPWTLRTYETFFSGCVPVIISDAVRQGRGRNTPTLLTLRTSTSAVLGRHTPTLLTSTSAVLVSRH